MSEDLVRDIEHLQTQLAFQEDTIEALNKALVDQQKQIEKLEFQMKHVLERQQQQTSSNINTAHEPPPHY
jgi:SlyX protein